MNEFCKLSASIFNFFFNSLLGRFLIILSFSTSCYLDYVNGQVSLYNISTFDNSYIHHTLAFYVTICFSMGLSIFLITLKEIIETATGTRNKEN